jgi:hypothetical protein
MMDNVIKVFFAVGFLFLWLNPQMVGVWEAKKDLAYDSYMDVHYGSNESNVE